jgi:hypothetical protein
MPLSFGGPPPSNSFNFQARVGAKGLGFRVRAFSFAWNLDYLIGVDFHHKADEAPLVVMQLKALLSGH